MHDQNPKQALEGAGVTSAFGKPLRFLGPDEAAQALKALKAGAMLDGAGRLSASAVANALTLAGRGNGAAHAAPVPASPSAPPAGGDLAAAIAGAIASYLPAPGPAPLDADAVRGIAARVVADALAAHKAAVDIDAIQGALIQALAPVIAATVKAEIDQRPPLQFKAADGELRDLPALRHEAFDELLSLVAPDAIGARMFQNVMLVGPAGTGKTELARGVAAALGRPYAFVSCSAGMSESALLGRMLPVEGGAFRYFESLFVKIYRDGGLFLLDEGDAADANLLVVINAALANGHLATPGGAVERHKDCVIVMACNTYGLTPGDRQYVGRAQLDAATLDRFVGAVVEVDYSERLERGIAGAFGPGGIEALRWAWTLRAAVGAASLRRVISTRAIVAACKAHHFGGAKGFARMQGRFFASWTPDERVKVGAPKDAAKRADWAALAAALGGSK